MFYSLLVHIEYQAEVDCKIAAPNGNPTEQDCDDLVIDGKEYARLGYPAVSVYETLNVCNYNTDDMKMNKQTGVEFFNNNGTFYENTKYPGEALQSGKCKGIQQKKMVPTSRAQYYMKATLQGPLMSGNDKVTNGYCSAYAFKDINFKYDYGLGECDVSVSNNASSTTSLNHDVPIALFVLALVSTFFVPFHC